MAQNPLSPNIFEQFDEAALEVLAHSRNLFPIVPGEGGGINPLADPDFTDDVMCEFYLLDPPPLNRVGTFDVRFRYRAGVPAAETFFDYWYFTFADYLADTNRVIENAPTVEWLPAAPLPDNGGLRDGVVRLNVPNWASDQQQWYARMGIVLPDGRIHPPQIDLLDAITDLSIVGTYEFVYRRETGRQFYLHWYATFDDLIYQRNRVVEGVPTARFEPIAPLPDVGTGYQLGEVTLTPADMPTTETLLPGLMIL